MKAWLVVVVIGVVSSALNYLVGFSIFLLMASGFIAYGPPPKFLWIWLGCSLWVVAAGLIGAGAIKALQMWRSSVG